MTGADTQADYHEDRIRQLEAELADAQERLDHFCEFKIAPGDRGWSEDEGLADTNFGLPVPRLEIRVERQGPDVLLCRYGLVYRHLLGQVYFNPFGSTKIEGGVSPGRMQELGWSRAAILGQAHLPLPFRDGAHIANEAVQLNLPAYVVNPGEKLARKLVLGDERGPKGQPYFREIELTDLVDLNKTNG